MAEGNGSIRASPYVAIFGEKHALLGQIVVAKVLLQTPETLEVVKKRIRAAYLDVPGGGFIDLLEYQEIERLDASSRPCDYGAGHFCFYVDGIDELAERMFSMGYRARSESCVDITAGPNKGARSLYLKDPDGYSIELFQKAPTQG
jgi:catechol 2,3-dioxygenase-like lactoylglutathione lyase family enzyme